MDTHKGDAQLNRIHVDEKSMFVNVIVWYRTRLQLMFVTGSAFFPAFECGLIEDAINSRVLNLTPLPVQEALRARQRSARERGDTLSGGN